MRALPDPLVFVLVLGARFERVLPLRLVAVVWRVVVGGRVRLALIRSLLVVDDLGPLAATGDRQRDSQRKRASERSHDFLPAGAGAGAGGAPTALGGAACDDVASGRPYAASQPHGGVPAV